jgi:hypothetical protein
VGAERKSQRSNDVADKQRPGTDTTPHGLDAAGLIAGEPEATVERDDDQDEPADGGKP